MRGPLGLWRESAGRSPRNASPYACVGEDEVDGRGGIASIPGRRFLRWLCCADMTCAPRGASVPPHRYLAPARERAQACGRVGPLRRGSGRVRCEPVRNACRREGVDRDRVSEDRDEQRAYVRVCSGRKACERIVGSAAVAAARGLGRLATSADTSSCRRRATEIEQVHAHPCYLGQ